MTINHTNHVLVQKQIPKSKKKSWKKSKRRSPIEENELSSAFFTFTIILKIIFQFLYQHVTVLVQKLNNDYCQSNCKFLRGTQNSVPPTGTSNYMTWTCDDYTGMWLLRSTPVAVSDTDSNLSHRAFDVVAQIMDLDLEKESDKHQSMLPGPGQSDNDWDRVTWEEQWQCLCFTGRGNGWIRYTRVFFQ